MRDGDPQGSELLERAAGQWGPGGGAMEMDTWYDLRIQQLFDLNDRVNDLLDEVTDSDEDAAPVQAQRVCELFDLTDRVSDIRKEVRGDK